MMVEIAQTLFARNTLRPRTIVPAGDSITRGASVLPSVGSGAEYALGYAEASIRTAGLRLLFNAGVAGDTSAQLRARFQTDVIDKDPDAVLLMIGTNNLLSGMSNAAYAALFNDIEAMSLMAMDRGILPIIVTPPPKNGAVAETKRAQPFYHWLAEHYGLPLLDAFSLLVDPATGQYLSGMGPDGTHPSDTGIAAVFPTFGAALSDLGSFIGNPYLAAVSESGTGDLANMIRNGSFALGSAPSSITGWTTNVTNNTLTLEAAVQPETGRIAKNVLSADAGIYALSGSGITVVPGDELIFSGKVKISGVVATANGAQLELSFGGGGQMRPMRQARLNGSFKFQDTLIVPDGKTSMTPRLYIDRIGTYEISNLTVINRTAMGSIWRPGQQ